MATQTTTQPSGGTPGGANQAQISQIYNSLKSASQSLSSGNVSGAYNSLSGASNAIPPTSPTPNSYTSKDQNSANYYKDAPGYVPSAANGDVIGDRPAAAPPVTPGTTPGTQPNPATTQIQPPNTTTTNTTGAPPTNQAGTPGAIPPAGSNASFKQAALAGTALAKSTVKDVPQNPAAGAAGVAAAGSGQSNQPQTQSEYQPSPAFLQTGSPILQQFVQQTLDAQAEVAAKGRLVDRLKTDMSAQLGALNADEMNIQNMMYASKDDIRQEFAKGGGVASESQIQGLANARNYDLIKSYNSLEAQKAGLSAQLQAQVGYASADLEYANAKLDAAAKGFQMNQSIIQNNRQQVGDLVTQLGYQGLASSLNSDEKRYVEQTQGWAPGFLDNPPQTYKEKNFNLALSRLQAEGGSYVSPDGSVINVNAPSTNSGTPSPSLQMPTQQGTGNAFTGNSAAGFNADTLKQQLTTSTKPKTISAATGLNPEQFNYLTGVNAPRSQLAQQALSKQLDPILSKMGIDLATFRTQYAAQNKVVADNIKRYNQTKVMEGEFDGTAKTLSQLVGDANFKSLNVENVAKVWAGQNVNDNTANQVAFQLTNLRNDYAGWLAASRGDAVPDSHDAQAAEQVILSGLNSHSIDGLIGAMRTTTQKNKAVLGAAIDNANKSVWDLFGAGDQYTPKYAPVQMQGPKGDIQSVPVDQVDIFKQHGYK